MKYTQSFIFTQREVGKDIEAISHQLCIRSGLIHQVSAGLYDILPIGQRVIKKLEMLIRQHIDYTGALEISMPIAQPAELWQESGRWGVYGEEMLQFENRESKKYCLGPTHEEVICNLVKPYLKSYKQLPFTLYQIGRKFRDEMRPRHGLIRTREFSMKDAYSFDRDSNSLDESYNKMRKAYLNLFSAIELKAVPTEAETGEIGGSGSEEFLAFAKSGESKFFLTDNEHGVQVSGTQQIGKEQEILTGIEVGHIFKLGDKYTKAMGLTYTDIDGQEKHPLMGCYGIGISRLLSALIEQHYDQDGILWPRRVSPFDLILISLNDTEEVEQQTEMIYQNFQNNDIEVLLDDRQVNAGVKFRDADLLGVPLRLLIGKRSLADGIVEYEIRKGKQKIACPLESILDTYFKLIS